MDFRDETVRGLAARVAAGALSARGLTEAALDRIEAVNDAVNAFVAVDGEAAMAAAAAVDDVIASGGDPGPLAGVPLAVKDLEDAAGFRTTKGSVCFADRPVATGDSILVARLKGAGAV
ncbi:MAG: amidase family protein, partial [Acidimicrobiales bacterium]